MGYPILYSIRNNEKLIQFNFEIISELRKGRWNDFTHYLREAFKIERDHNGTPRKIVVSEEVFSCLDEWFTLTVTQLQDLDKDIIELIIAILRSLRNCISNSDQKYVIEHTNVLTTCNVLFSKLIEIDQNNLCLKVLLQFLVNLISSYKEAAGNIYNIFYEKIKICLNNGIYFYECSALIYNVTLAAPVNDIEIINLVFGNYNSDDQNEFVCFFLENSIATSYFWNIYKQLKMENKIAILEILRHMQLKKRSHNLPKIGLEVLTNIFLNSGDTVFQIKQTEENDLHIYEISLILEILASLSSDEYYLKELQNNKEILIHAGVFLINIHRLGQVSKNYFTPVQKLSEFSTQTELKEHPAFGFKADLIRLIGNLCWRNRELQNLARNAELIPVILDCCNMDARNPFIIQWSILAVRNLCENNQENQQVIASLHQEGTVSSDVLDELGVPLQDDGDSCLKIVPLDSLKSNLKK